MSETVEITVTPMHADGASTTTLEFNADAELRVFGSMWKPEDGDDQLCLCIRARQPDGSLRIETGILDIDPADNDKLANEVGLDERGRSPAVLALLGS